MASNSIFVGKKMPSLKLIYSSRVGGTFSIPSTIETGDLAVAIGGASDTSPDGVATVTVGSSMPNGWTNATSFRTAATTGTAYGITCAFKVLNKLNDAGLTGLTFVGADNSISHTLAIFRYCYDNFTVAVPIDGTSITYTAANVPTTSAGIILSIPGVLQNVNNHVLNLAGGWGTNSMALIRISAPNMTEIQPSDGTNSAMSYQIYEPDEMPFGYDAYVRDTGSQLGANIQFIIPILGA